MPGPSAFVYAGLDFILDEAGQWHFLEANDHPVGLAIADRLSVGRPDALFAPGAIAALARALADRAGPDLVALLPPDAFRVDPKCRERNIHGHLAVATDDQRANLTVDEFDALVNALDDLDAPWVLANPDDLQLRRGQLTNRDGRRIGALYRRHQGLPAELYVVPAVNDIRLRLICPDKRRTAEIVAVSGPSIQQPAAVSIGQGNQVDDWLDHKQAHAWVIIKPNEGTASRGVRRERLADVRKAGSPALGGGNLVQDWIEPATMERNGRPYRFDVRVFVVDGVMVGAFARTAAAPADGRLADSPLSWLTTTGPLAPLVQAPRRTSAEVSEAVELPVGALEELDRQCRLVVAALDSAVEAFTVASAVSSVRPYSELAGIDGDMTVVPLCGRVASWL